MESPFSKIITIIGKNADDGEVGVISDIKAYGSPEELGQTLAVVVHTVVASIHSDGSRSAYLDDIAEVIMAMTRHIKTLESDSPLTIKNPKAAKDIQEVLDQAGGEGPSTSFDKVAEKIKSLINDESPPRGFYFKGDPTDN